MPFTLPLGARAPDFCLSSTEGEICTLATFSSAKGIVLFFTCNHCPYVVGSDEITRQIAEKYMRQNIAFVAINSNSKNTYAQDSFACMVDRMREHQFPWVYLYDPTQAVAKAYGALRTPHFYLFNQERKLIYTGRAVDSPKDASKITSHDLKRALEEYVQNAPITVPLTNPIGCNVKWDGKDPHWMPEEACDLVTKK